MQTSFFIRINGLMQRIFFHEVLYITAKKNYSEVITTSKRKLCIYASLSCMEEKLPTNLFCRVHRSYIVATEHIEAFDHFSVYIGDEKLPMGRQYLESLLGKVLVICSDHDAKLKEELKNMDPEKYVNNVKKRKANQ